eukprot:CAMPEP_0203812602 /NCGR_PEP_ID=MMETSP0115-20131106/4242_1 /ASSEMBLY_ACC=CAM_ASM_000227 /TAXON_ID=33651 /ORGANISM="Bicosoecid sp, Strain ms1" /LENGTH=1107 /DNA_ID=CAMNT_0050721449 /DNA_START=269 /DNA_END=3588 /DNA_ORIENTATION=-
MSSRRGGGSDSGSGSGKAGTSADKPKETYEEWLARVEKKNATKKFMQKRAQQEEESRKQHGKAESGESYDLWLKKKAVAEKAMALLGELDNTRADDDGTWREAAIALHAVNATLANSGVKTGLRKAWVEWSKKHHRFDEIRISREEAFDRLTGGARSMLEKSGDEFVIYGLVYSYPPLPKKPGDIVKPLTPDDKFKNEVFERTVARVWKETKKAMAAKLEAGCKERLDRKKRAEAARSGKPAEGADGGADEAKAGEEGAAAAAGGGGGKEAESDAGGSSSSGAAGGEEAKAGEGGETTDGDDAKADDDDAGGEKPKAKAKAGEEEGEEDAAPKASVLDSLPPEEAAALRGRTLATLGVQALTKWVESDKEVVAQREQADVEEREGLARRAHEGWANKKLAMRIRVPVPDDNEEKKPGGKWKPPRFNFGKPGGVKTVRNKKVKMNSTTLDFVKTSGLNLKYVHASGGQADLMASRKKLLKKGYVFKENFADPDDGTVDSDGEDQFRRELEGNEKRKKKMSESKQAEKAAREKYGGWASLKDMRDRAVSMLPAISLPAGGGDQARITWMRVGRALKAVDRTLLNVWTEWSMQVDDFPPGDCAVAWDSFAPVCCDTHAPSSAVRDTFLKLLHRRGVNYKAGFERMKEELRLKAERRGEDFDEGSDGLTPPQFKKMLMNLGVALQKGDIRRLVSLFDLNGDGFISAGEFLSFVGDKRRTLGDLDEALRGRCVWENRCHQCGMAAAYDYVPDIESGRSSRKGGAAGSAKGGAGGSGGRVSFKRVSLPDHDKKGRQKYHRGDGGDADKPPTACEESKWDQSKRESGLKALADMSRDVRKAAAEEALWRLGSPPLNPGFDRITTAALKAHVSESKKPDAAAEAKLDDDVTDANSLHLVWGQPAGSDPVNFYVLESSGAEGSASQRNGEWHKVYTDPPTAYEGATPRGQFTIKGLAPATSFHFRLRAYNLHGASAYAIKVFTTAPLTPAAPLVVNSTAKMLKLQWGESEELRHRVKKLRETFERCDKDGSGTINRAEMLSALKRDRHMRRFLENATDSDGMNPFDAMEGNDDEELSWEEFYTYLVAHGVLTDKRVAKALAASSSAASASGGDTAR